MIKFYLTLLFSGKKHMNLKIINLKSYVFSVQCLCHLPLPTYMSLKPTSSNFNWTIGIQSIRTWFMSISVTYNPYGTQETESTTLLLIILVTSCQNYHKNSYCLDIRVKGTNVYKFHYITHKSCKIPPRLLQKSIVNQYWGQFNNQRFIFEEKMVQHVWTS